MQCYTFETWVEEATKRFGSDSRDWTFVCPQCGTIQSVQDLLDAGVGLDVIEKHIAFNCVGQFSSKIGCDWSLGGLIKIHMVEIVYSDDTVRPCFEFADPFPCEEYPNE